MSVTGRSSTTPSNSRRTRAATVAKGSASINMTGRIAMLEDDSADFSPLISREQAENEFCRALNLFAGRGRRYSVETLATGSGVPKRLIECFRGYPVGHPDHRVLHFGHKMSIISFLGPKFTTEWLKLCDQAAREIGPLD